MLWGLSNLDIRILLSTVSSLIAHGRIWLQPSRVFIRIKSSPCRQNESKMSARVYIRALVVFIWTTLFWKDEESGYTRSEIPCHHVFDLSDLTLQGINVNTGSSLDNAKVNGGVTAYLCRRELTSQSMNRVDNNATELYFITIVRASHVMEYWDWKLESAGDNARFGTR